MNQVVLIHSENEFLLKSKIKEHIYQINALPDNIFRIFSISEVFNMIYEEMITPNFFDDSKLFIFEKSNELSSLSNYNNNLLINIIKSPPPNVYLIFIHQEKALFTSDFFNILLRYAYLEQLPLLNDIEMSDFVKIYAKNVHNLLFDNSTTGLLLSLCNNNLFIIDNELQKLKCYLNETSVVTAKDIIECVPQNYDELLYEIISLVVSKQTKKAYDLYTEFSKKENDPLRIITNFSRACIEIYQVKKILKDDKRPNALELTLNVSQGRAYFMKKNASMISDSKVQELINILLDIDFKVKAGQLDKQLAFELFLLNYC